MYKSLRSKRYIADIAATLDYISRVLKNFNAAKKLRDKINEGQECVEMYPEAFTNIDTKQKTKHIYRRYIVGNYNILYYFEDDVVNFERFVYAPRDMENVDLI